MRCCFIIIIIACIFYTPLFAYQAGSSGLVFLKMGAGARATGMGEAFVAVVDDATAAYWNPAGLLESSKTAVNFTHNKWLQDIRHEFFSVAFPWAKQYFALSVSYNSVGEIEYRTGPTSEPLATVSAHDLAVGLSYSRRISSKIAAGTSVKFVHEKIYLDTSSGFAMDIGMKFDPNFSGISFGAAVKNIGNMSKMRNEQIDLPTQLQIGAAWCRSLTTVLSDIIIAADYVNDEFEQSYYNFGTELVIQKILALRMGYQLGYDTKDISAGIGFKFGRYSLDYAYVPYKQSLGNVQRFSLNINL